MKTTKDLEKSGLIDYNSIKNWSYPLAKKWVQEHLVPQGINSVRKFFAYSRSGKSLPANFPRDPRSYFNTRNTWQGWNDFFGTSKDKRQLVDYMPFEEAKALAQRAKLSSTWELRHWEKRPKNFPTHPESQYEEFTTWEDFFGDYYRSVDKRGANGKLKVRDVKIIKHQLSLGVSSAALARMFNVSDMQIFRIKSGENWGHIEI